MQILRSSPRRRGWQRGMTLIELMIVVCVIAILLSLAVPAYLDQIRRARRSDAIKALLEIASAQEKNAYVYGRFAADLKKAPATDPADSGLGLADVTPGGWYQLSMTVDNTGFGFVASAVPKNGQEKDSCGTLSIDHSGVRAASGPNPSCW